MATFTHGSSGCACSREKCDYTCMTYAAYMGKTQNCLGTWQETIIANGTPIKRCRFYSLDQRCCVIHNTRCPCEDYNPVKKPQTNADRIRAMSDEELAKFMVNGCDAIAQGECKRHPGCLDCWLDWLRQEEVKE